LVRARCHHSEPPAPDPGAHLGSSQISTMQPERWC
jgi:hypothetical protein